MAADTVMDDMDIVFDEEEDPEILRLQADVDAIRRDSDEGRAAEAMDGVDEAPEEGEYDGNAVAPNKVHLRGVDKMNTNHIRQFAEEHYPLDLFQKVEWIDDTSVNVVYDTELAAAEALVAFSAEEASEPLQLREAKRLFTHPDTALQVRQATVSDVKVQHAKERSAFYLHNPEWDPENRMRKRRRPDYGGYGGNYANKYPRREWDDDQNERRRMDISFTEDMYDEQPRAVDMGRRGSSYSDGEYGRRRVRYDEEEDLMPRPTNARPRERSASPRRSGDLMSRPTDRRYRQRSASPRRREDLMPRTTNASFRDRTLSPRRDTEGDGRYGFNEQYPRRRTPRARSRTPPGLRAGHNNGSERDESRKELFANHPPSSALTGGAYSNGSSLKTPGRPSTSSSARELFPEKVNNSAHKRKDAIDLRHANDELVDAMGKYNISNSRADEQYTYDRSGRRPEYDDRARYERNERGGRGGGDLFSRTSGGPPASSDAGYGRLNDRSPVPRSAIGDAGFNIKGAGAGAGFNIRGASRKKSEEHPRVTELFPGNTIGGHGVRGNSGRELFAEGLGPNGRDQQRQQRARAEHYN